MSSAELDRLHPAETHAFAGRCLPGSCPARSTSRRRRPRGENVARRYRYNGHAELGGSSRLADLKAEHERRGVGRSNRRYSYVVGS